MKMQQKNIAKKFVSVLIVWCMIVGGLITLLVPITGSSNVTLPEPMSIDEVINGTFVIENWGVFDMDGNITVNSGGTLKIVNSTLNFLQDTNYHDYHMTVNGGSLIMQNSTITTGASEQVQWDPVFDMAFTNANLTMTDYSALAFPGTLTVTNTVTFINDSWITSLWPDALSTVPDWAEQFPTFTDVINTWWAGSPVDLDDSTDDGPVIRFLNCNNITIADSRIDELVEDSTLPLPGNFNVQFYPDSIDPTFDQTGNDVNSLGQDGNYYTLGSWPSCIWVNSFDTGVYTDTNYMVNNVILYVEYNNPEYSFQAINTSKNYFNYSRPGLANQTAFLVGQNQTSDVFNTTNIFANVNTLAQINTLNVTFINYDDDIIPPDAFNIDIIRLDVTLQRRFPPYPTMLTLDNSEMTMINTYINADWLSFTDDFQSKNAMDLVNGSHLYLYNVSIDGAGNSVPPGDPAPYMPYRVASGCQVYHHKWMDARVVDRYNAPVEGANITANFDSVNSTYITWVANNNSLSNGVLGSDEWASELRMLAYLDRTQSRPVDSSNYNRTDANGRLHLPLLCEFLNQSCYPNGEHVGNYILNVSYYLNGAWYNDVTSCEFQPFPNVLPEQNLVDAGTIALDGLELPRQVGESQGLIVNATTGNLLLNAYGSGYEYPYIIVEDGAVLEVKNAYLNMTLMEGEMFQILVRDNGVLVMDNVTIESSPNTMQVLFEDNAWAYINNTNTSAYVDILASDNANVTFNHSTIKGNFDVTDQTSAVYFTAIDTVFWQDLDDFAGNSYAILKAVYSPSGILVVNPTDNSVAYIFRKISVNVIDGVTPGNAIENANVWLNSTSIEPGHNELDQSGTTNTLGTCEFFALSNKIRAETTGPVSVWIGDYALAVEFRGHTNTTFIGLPDSDKMALSDANRYLSVKLSGVLPDLDPPMSVWPSTTIGRGDIVLINTTVNNTGDSIAKNILVRFNDTFNGVNTTIYETTIPELQPIGSPNNTCNISFSYSWVESSKIGVHNVTVMVDPNNAILEQPPDGELNNNNSVNITVGQQADLTFQFYSDVWFSESYIVVNRTFTIVANVWNTGDIAANNVTVSFYQGEGGRLLGNTTINVPAISASTPAYLTVTGGFNLSGTYLIYVVIDGLNNVTEVSELNNNNTPGHSLRIWMPSDLTIDLLEFIVDGTPELDIYNRTSGTLRARVLNSGEMPESPFVDFYDGTTANLIGTVQLPALDGGDYDYAELPWIATCNALTQNHTLIAEARLGAYENPTGLSNLFQSWLIVTDDRPDLWVDSEEILPVGTTQIPENTEFELNVTFVNSGINAALNVTVSVYDGVADDDHWLGSATLARLEGSGRTATMTVTCDGVSGVGDHTLLIVADPDTNFTDSVTGYPALNLTGSVEEYDESNNDDTLDISVVLPPLTLRIILPATGDNTWEIGEASQILVAVQVVRTDAQSVGVEGVTVTATMSQTDQSGTNVSTSGGEAIIILPVPSTVGNYTITVSAPGASSVTQWFLIISPPAAFPWWIIILIVIIVVAVIVGATLYLYFVGLGKTVQCGECGAFIPETAKKCPKCGVEFETEVAKCSVCGAWVPIDVKNCPECKTEFTVGAEELEDYETKMKRQYDAVVSKFKDKAKRELGDKFTETQFQAWWAKQPTFMTFDQWLREEEEMKRMGSKPCPACGTENSVTAKICHRCGTLMVAEEAPRKPVGKMPEKKEPPRTPPAAAAAAPAVARPPPTTPPAQHQAPAPAAAPPAKKKCPSCGMEVALAEKMCPICNHNFEAPGAAAGGPQAVRVVRKPVKKIIRRMPGEPAGEDETGGGTEGQ
jgi:ribosomal protein L40E